MSGLASIVAVIGLVALNAFFVTAEYSLLTARRGTLGAGARRGSRGSEAALRLMDHPVRVISTVQVAISAIAILTGAIGEPLVRDLLGEDLPAAIGFLLAFAIVTYLTVVFGELVPKAISLDRAEALAGLIAAPIELIGKALSPVVWLLDRSATAVLRLFGIRHVVAGRSVETATDLRDMVDEAEQTGAIPRAQEELLHNIFDFATLEAADAMVPAHEVVWLDAGASPSDALETMIESVHTRFPVGERSLDHLVGVIHSREIATAVRDGEPSTIRPLVRQAFVVPETKDLGALLREFRASREQLAMIVSEYGITLGIVTVEDILEEIVGEIENEYELPDSRIEQIDAKTVRVAGSMTVDDFNESEGAGLPQDGPRTMAGLVFNRLGRAAVPGDRISIEGLELHVTDVEDARITSLEVRQPGEGGAASTKL